MLNHLGSRIQALGQACLAKQTASPRSSPFPDPSQDLCVAETAQQDLGQLTHGQNLPPIGPPVTKPPAKELTNMGSLINFPDPIKAWKLKEDVAMARERYQLDLCDSQQSSIRGGAKINCDL